MRAFVSGLGLVQLAAFASLWVQLDGLLASRGILPAALLLERVREARGAAAWLERPTLLWLGASDAALHALCAGGVVLAIAALRAATLAALAVELVLPLAAFAGRRGRLVACSGFAALLALSLLAMLDRLGLRLPRPQAVHALQQRLRPFLVANAYGLFAVMTTERPELELLGSDDGSSWRAYAFRYKPGPPERAPRFAPLHMPRLDWQLWFAALDRCEHSPWLAGVLLRLLEGEPAVRAFLAEDPFPERPPRMLRVDRWLYRFAPPGDSAWWRREPLGSFCPPLELRAGRLALAAGVRPR